MCMCMRVDALQGTRHAEFQAIDQVLEQCGGDASKADFARYSPALVTLYPCTAHVHCRAVPAPSLKQYASS